MVAKDVSELTLCQLLKVASATLEPGYPALQSELLVRALAIERLDDRLEGLARTILVLDDPGLPAQVTRLLGL